ncbi:hypothetical protein CF327_g565 [Tilletia walkeri]|uniref:U3 small nucleolar RNA-associated protein 11 n=1 Tax=Tilletia walkeri TaxID=117179 RepID=A0A8X7NCW0_9BASI|nr:hypothetical protein CF327_g565 [Tilletia walkeri]KAE8271606.1 hypothetical protein A4X09_0g732 [Tilletia walkeri]
MALRNVIQRRNHKERSQLSHRKGLGLLEKHKDYVQRARDHHEKRDRLKRLREKAEMRNKDEFYFGMVRSKTNEGVHVQERGAAVLDNDTALVLKTQDAGYLRNKIKDERKQIDTLVEQISPSLPSLRAAWVEEKEGRSEALEEAGLLGAIASSSGKGKGKAKARDDPKSPAARGSARNLRSAIESGSSLANAGKRTVWCDNVKQVGAYKGSSDSKEADAEKEDDADDDTQGARERHIGYLTGLLGARQGRLRTMLQALEKVNFARSPNTTKERKR